VVVVIVVVVMVVLSARAITPPRGAVGRSAEAMTEGLKRQGSCSRATDRLRDGARPRQAGQQEYC